MITKKNKALFLLILSIVWSFASNLYAKQSDITTYVRKVTSILEKYIEGDELFQKGHNNTKPVYGSFGITSYDVSKDIYFSKAKFEELDRLIASIKPLGPRTRKINDFISVAVNNYIQNIELQLQGYFTTKRNYRGEWEEASVKRLVSYDNILDAYSNLYAIMLANKDKLSFSDFQKIFNLRWVFESIERSLIGYLKKESRIPFSLLHDILGTEFYSKMVKMYPNEPVAHYKLGRADFRNRKAHFLRAVKLKSDYADAHFELAEIYLRNKEFKKSILHFNTALKNRKNLVDNRISEVYFGLALSYKGEKNYDKAKNNLKVAIENTENKNARLERKMILGEILENQKQFAEALQVYELVKREPVDKNRGQGGILRPKRSFYLEEEYIVYKINRMNAAIVWTAKPIDSQDEFIRRAKEVLEICPTMPEVYVHLTKLYLMQGKPDYALKTLEDTLFYSLLITVLKIEQLGFPKLDIYTKEVSITTNTLPGLFLDSLEDVADGKIELAKNKLAMARELNPDYLPTMLLTAYLYVLDGKKEESIAWFKKASEKSDDRWKVLIDFVMDELRRELKTETKKTETTRDPEEFFILEPIRWAWHDSNLKKFLK